MAALEVTDIHKKERAEHAAWLPSAGETVKYLTVEEGGDCSQRGRRKRHPTGGRNSSQTGGAQAHPRREGKGPGGLWGSRKYPITLRGVRRVSEPDVTAASIPPTPLLLLPSLPATSPLRPPLGLAAREATHSTGGFARVDPGQHFLVQINKWPSVWKHRPAFPGEVTRVRPLKVCRRPALPGSSPRAGPRRPGEGEPVPDQRPFRGWALTPPRGQRVQELQREPEPWEGTPRRSRDSGDSQQPQKRVLGYPAALIQAENLSPPPPSRDSKLFVEPPGFLVDGHDMHCARARARAHTHTHTHTYMYFSSCHCRIASFRK
nr:uncharacterized protein LOC129485396 [Symphalangus syndactylus]